MKAEMLKASDIIKDPEIIDKIEGRYQIIKDISPTNLNQAINIMARKGWKCVNITGGFSTIPNICALMEKPT